jgi:hypothetical protein
LSNKYLPHLHILPEDDANREFANGFLLDDRVRERNIQVLKPAGGWVKAVDSIRSCGLLQNPERRLLVLIDFDDNVETRLPEVLAGIPQDVVDRVYILGTATNPERLKVSMGMSLEKIGLEVARQCADRKDDLWKHALLQHNAAELARLTKDVRGIVIR